MVPPSRGRNAFKVRQRWRKQFSSQRLVGAHRAPARASPAARSRRAERRKAVTVHVQGLRRPPRSGIDVFFAGDRAGEAPPAAEAILVASSFIESLGQL